MGGVLMICRLADFMKLTSLSFCFTEHHVLIVLTACIIPPSDACTQVNLCLSILKRPKRLQPKHKLTKPPIHITRIRNQPQPRSVGPGRHEGGADGLGR